MTAVHSKADDGEETYGGDRCYTVPFMGNLVHWHSYAAGFH